MAKILANYGGLLAAAMGQTLLLALCGLFFACIIGLVVGLMSVVKNRACNIIATIFVDVIRGVPMIVLAFYVFFAVPMLLNNIMHLNTMLGINPQLTLTALQAGTICLALNCGAYMAEIIRAGIESVDKGQMEAARSLGMTHRKAMRLIVIPQALKIVLPSFGNEFVSLIKETSVLSYVGVVEILRRGALWNAATFNTFEAYVGVALVYMLLSIPTSKLIKHLEKKMATDKQNDDRTVHA